MNDVLAGVRYSLIYRAVSILKHFFENKSNAAHKVVLANLAFMECWQAFAAKDKDLKTGL